MITTRGIPKPVGWGALLLGVTAVAVAGVHDQHRAQAREQGRLWAASYYAKARAEIADDERRAGAKERRAQAGSHRGAACDAHLPRARCLAADEGTSTVVTTAYRRASRWPSASTRALTWMTGGAVARRAATAGTEAPAFRGPAPGAATAGEPGKGRITFRPSSRNGSGRPTSKGAAAGRRGVPSVTDNEE